jgi:iron complex transport system permease protein
MEMGHQSEKSLAGSSSKLDQMVFSYRAYTQRKTTLFFIFLAVLVCTAGYAVTAGSFKVSLNDTLAAILGNTGGPESIVIRQIRLPRIMAAIIAGWGLGLSGAVMQCLLKNPLASPFTLGISHAAAFGAAFAIIVLGAGGIETAKVQVSVVQTTSAAGPMTVRNIYSVTGCAFFSAAFATGIILLLARLKKMSSESIILAGVALSSLFVSGTILVQYFATEVEIASVVFWTFGDVSRCNWQEISVMATAVSAVTIYFVFNRWNLNALSAGEDVAGSLGVNVDTIRLWGMLISALVAALITSFLGVIAFLGLLAPHIGKRLVGSDHRYLVPHSCIIGGMLLLVADTISRILVGSGTLPVGVMTSFMGAPLFLYLLIRGYSK